MKFKNLIVLGLLILSVLCLSSCSDKVRVVKTHKATTVEEIEGYVTNNQMVTIVTYYDMSDGTYMAEGSDYVYRYILEISKEDGEHRFLVLSSREDITYEQALYNSLTYYKVEYAFKPEEAVLVGMTL